MARGVAAAKVDTAEAEIERGAGLGRSGGVAAQGQGELFFFLKKKNKLNKNGSRIPESSFQPGPYDGPSPTRPQRPGLPIFFFIFALPLWLDFSS